MFMLPFKTSHCRLSLYWSFQFCDFKCNTDTNFLEKNFKIESDTITCNYQKVGYLLKCRIYGKTSHINKEKFGTRFKNFKSAHRSHGIKQKVSK